MASAPMAGRKSRSGTFRNGMEYVTWGSGPKTLLFVQGGPGVALPAGIWLRMGRRLLDPYVKAGFTVWIVTRCRHMPPGHTIADMADDYAQVIAEEFGGWVDLVVAEDVGGMVAQYLAAFHPGRFGHIALMVTAAEASDWAKDVDSRMAAALARGDRGGAGTVLAEALLAGKYMRWVRRMIGPVIGWLMLARDDPPPADVLIEAQAEKAFDSRAVLPRIQAPVLLLCGDRDRAFPKDVVEETAGLIPDCTLIWYKGGTVRAASNKRVPRDVLAFVNRSEEAA